MEKLQRVNRILVGIIFVLLIALVSFIYLYSSKNTATNISPVPQQVVQKLINLRLISYSIYLAEYQGHGGMFLSGDINTTKGNFYAFDEGFYSNINFENLTNLKDYYALPNGSYNAKVIDMKYSSDQNISYVSILYYVDDEDGNPVPINAVYGLTFEEDYLENLENKEIWINKIKSGKSYGGYDGVARINRIIENKYLELFIDKCYECKSNINREIFTAANLLIVNIQTSKELFLGNVSNIKYNTENGIVNYSKQISKLVPCDDNQTVGCDDKHMMKVYQASNETFSSKVP